MKPETLDRIMLVAVLASGLALSAVLGTVIYKGLYNLQALRRCYFECNVNGWAGIYHDGDCFCQSKPGEPAERLWSKDERDE